MKQKSWAKYEKTSTQVESLPKFKKYEKSINIQDRCSYKVYV